MTEYIVRVTGNDITGDGLSPSTAWATPTKAMATVAAGDIVWFGAGVYRGNFQLSTSGTNGSEIEWCADINGSNTGDAGLVIWTALTDETGSGGTGSTLDLNGKEFNEFHDIILGPGGSGVSDRTLVASTGNTSYQGTLFDTCSFVIPIDTLNITIDINHNSGSAITGGKPAFRNCHVIGNVYIGHGSFASDIACGWQVEGCVIIGALTIDGPLSGSFGATGYSVTNNTFIYPHSTCISVGDQWATGTIGTIANNTLVTNDADPIDILGDGGTWTQSNNYSVEEVDAYAFLFGFQVEHIFRKWYGWTPYAAYEQVYDLGSGYKSGGIDAGSATYASATDMLGHLRPMGTADDVGAVEARGRGTRSSTWAADGSTYSMAFDSIGYQSLMIPVNAEETTISVKAYKDASYTGTAPKLEVLIGDTSQGTDSMTVGTEEEETLSVTFTPLAAGWAQVRLWSYATAGKVFFDTSGIV